MSNQDDPGTKRISLVTGAGREQGLGFGCGPQGGEQLGTLVLTEAGKSILAVRLRANRDQP